LIWNDYSRVSSKHALVVMVSASEGHRQVVTNLQRLDEPLSIHAVAVCLVSSNVERYFVDLAPNADDAVLRTLEQKTLADSLSELRILDAAR
jgi:hypothetical protein